MNKKMLFVPAVILAVGAFALTRPHKANIPSDFKDAVGEEAQEFNTAIPAFKKSDANLPEPKTQETGFALQNQEAAAGHPFLLKGLRPGDAYGKWEKSNTKAARKIFKASDNLPADRLKGLPGATAFDKLKNLFNEGVPATKESLTGWYAGRLVSAQKDDFVASLLMGIEMPANSNGGPLFEGDKVFKVFLITPPSASISPDFYDNMSGTLMTELKNKIMSGDYSEASFALEFPGAKVVAELDTVKVTLDERVARGYVVERFARYDKPAGTLQSEYYTYYFKNVTPKQ